MKSNYILQQIKESFLAKKYDFTIKLFNEFVDQNRIPAGLNNLIGISYILRKNKEDKDVLLGLDCFEKAFLSEKKTIHGMEGLCNLITVASLNLENKELNEEILEYLRRSEKYFLDSEPIFNNNLKLLTAGATLFKFLLDNEKEKQLLQKLINYGSDSKIIISKYLYTKNYSAEWSQQDHYLNSKKYASVFTKLNSTNIKKIDYKKNNKIRLGIVSSDLNDDHSISYFLSNTLANLNINTFELYAFSFYKPKVTENNQIKLKKLFHKWIDVYSLNNQSVINLIQDNKIEILIDLMGYTSGERIQIFNTRICPIQISWLAYCNTLGFENIDYIIADKNLILEKEEKYYAEKIIKLPNIWNSHSGFTFNRNPRPYLKKQDKKITFGSFGNFRKISNEVVETWSIILSQLDNTELILKSSINFDYYKLLEKFEKKGVKNKIKIFKRTDFLNLEDHINFYDKIDLALDTFPYNGVTTTFEALWKGVPVITMMGYNFNSRCGESIIKNAGYNQLIAKNKNEYFEIAKYYYDNIKELEKLRDKIFNEVLYTTLFDTKLFSNNFENMLLKIHKKKNL